MTHELFSVWKEVPAFVAKTPWKLQMPKGILSFKTKKKATAVADQCKALAATNPETLTQETSNTVRRIL